MRRTGFAAEFRDAVTPRTFALMVGVLLVQLGFLLSYIGAFHHPDPQRVPVAVVAPQQVVDRLDDLSGHPVEATAVRDEAAARERIMQRDAQAAYLMNPSGGTDTLLVASAGGSAVTDAVERIGEQVAAGQQRQLKTEDIAPAGEQDHGSLTAFYLVIGWMVGGYLASSLLGVSAGARPANERRCVIRLGSLAVYAVVSGIGGAVIVGPVLGALSGHFWQLAGLGALIVFAAGAATLAFQVFLGTVGVGLAIVVFVVLGNPSAGGAYQAHLIPPFWRAVGAWLPPEAGTTAVRNIVYFDGNALARPLWTLAAWAAAGTVLALVGALRTQYTSRMEGLPLT